MMIRLVSLSILLAAHMPTIHAQEAGRAPQITHDTAWSESPPPTPKADGTKWRIGYFSSGDYTEYPRNLRNLAEGLQQLGWVAFPPIPPNLTSAEMWAFLSTHASSATVEFVANAHWQPGNFDPAQRSTVRQSISDRLTHRKDIDLMIAMGTWAGEDMAQLGAPVPTIVGSTSDPVKAGIVKSAQDSGLDNLFARVEPERYLRQVRLFHEIVPFKRLGIVYDDSPEGRSYGAVDAVQQAAQREGFAVEHCVAPSLGIPMEKAIDNATECYRQLAPKVDAVYVTTHRGVRPDSIGSIAAILADAKVPSFSMGGSDEVKAGILISLAQADYSYVGLFYAEAIANIFNGATPRSLNQIWVDPAKIALNLHTARVIGFDPPIDVLLAADEVYQAQ